ncbi:MAG: hypothetical protein GY788_15600 [bacterium]|nr:hypothetical protein [bacterium]
MRDGADRTEVPYVWPRTLLVPEPPPKLVYLDLNHWISLAKAVAGHPDGEQSQPALEACLNAVASGSAVFPISDTVYFEVSKIGQYRQRRDIREVIERISRFMVVTGRSVVSAHEIEALLDEKLGPNPRPINTMLYLDWGVARAFGQTGGFRIKTRDGQDVTAETRLQHPEGPESFDARLAEAELDLNRQILDGPTAGEEPEMRALGWNPLAAFEVAKDRATQEIEQVERFDLDPKWRRGRIRDVVSAREVTIEILDALLRALQERSAELEDLFDNPEAARDAFDSMPSFDVAVTIKTSLHRNPNHQWKSNDISDIDALGSTIPYCDVVVTDAAMASHAASSGLAKRLNTTVLSRLSELPDHLG